MFSEVVDGTARVPVFPPERAGGGGAALPGVGQPAAAPAPGPRAPPHPRQDPRPLPSPRQEHWIADQTYRKFYITEC